MHCSELSEQECKVMFRTQGQNTAYILKEGILKLVFYIHFCSGKRTWNIQFWTENVISLTSSHKALLKCFSKLTEKNFQKQ